MDSFEIVPVLTFLIPGFLAAGVIRSLVTRVRSSEFERIVQALILTIVVRALVIVMRPFYEARRRDGWPSWGTGDDATLIASVLVSLIAGIAIAACWNHDVFHAVFRKLRITKQRSFPSEWYAAFQETDCYVVLHLTNGNRLYGNPSEWPNESGTGHFRLVEAEWLTETNERIPLAGVSQILVPGADVSMVEFMTPLGSNSAEGSDS